jgi:hypothetical protein
MGYLIDRLESQESPVRDEDTLAMSIALDLKRIICLMLCGHISVEIFRAERIALLEKFNAGCLCLPNHEDLKS